MCAINSSWILQDFQKIGQCFQELEFRVEFQDNEPDFQTPESSQWAHTGIAKWLEHQTCWTLRPGCLILCKNMEQRLTEELGWMITAGPCQPKYFILS